jgi:hypothetical protein
MNEDSVTKRTSRLTPEEDADLRAFRRTLNRLNGVQEDQQPGRDLFVTRLDLGYALILQRCLKSATLTLDREIDNSFSWVR